MKEHDDVVVTPIYYWYDEDVWDYIRQENLSVNPLYKQGYHRVGCVGCPLATYKQTMKEFGDFPKYRQAYIKAFDRMLVERKKSGKVDFGNQNQHWKTGKDVFDWWVEENLRSVKGQYNLFEEDILG